MSPSDLSWWTWLGLGGIGVVLGVPMYRAAVVYNTKFGRFMAVLVFSLGSVCGLIGIIRFVKWAWTG
jgi:hypothetical protein